MICTNPLDLTPITAKSINKPQGGTTVIIFWKYIKHVFFHLIEIVDSINWIYVENQYVFNILNRPEYYIIFRNFLDWSVMELLKDWWDSATLLTICPLGGRVNQWTWHASATRDAFVTINCHLSSPSQLVTNRHSMLILWYSAITMAKSAVEEDFSFTWLWRLPFSTSKDG